MKQYYDRESAFAAQNICSAARALRRLLLAAVVTAAAFASSAEALPTWAQSFGNIALTNDNSNDPFAQGFDYTNGIAPMPDGGVVVVGVLGQPKGQQNFFSSKSVLLRYGPDGANLWQKDLGNVESDAQNFVTADAQGNVYFASGAPGPGFAYPFVAKFDPNGTLIWFKNVKVPGPPVTDGNGMVRTNYINTPFTGMSLTADGSSVILGCSVTGQNTNDDINGVTIPAIVIVNTSNGGANCLALNSTLSRDTRYTSAAFAVALSTTTGRYALLTGSPDGSKELVLVDSGGNTIATKETVGFDPLTRMIATTDGGFLVVQRSGGANPSTALRKFGADLSLQFQKVSFSFQAESVAQTPDGGYQLCAQGTIDPLVYPPAGGAGHDKVLLIKLDAQCNLVSAAALGGPRAEAHYGFMSYPTAAVLTTDGGIALATHTSSYSGDATDKPDWWVAKTTLLGRIQNFKDAMFDVTSSASVTDANASNGFPPPQAGVGFNDPKALGVEGPIKLDRNGNQPPTTLSVTDATGNVHVQASPPRIVSERSTEAVVGQHFSFHILADFFDAGAVITYSATGLPQGFVLDPKTGVISGVAPVGSETTQPIVITIQATDGKNSTAPVPLALTIGDGVPSFTVNGLVAQQPPTTITGLADSVLSFAAQEPGTLAGRSMRVQVSTDGSTFTNLPNGTDGFMTYDPSSGNYVLNSTSYPLQNGVSFRVKLTAVGHPDVISNVVGLFDLTSSKPHLGQTVFNKLYRNGLNADFDFKVTETPAPSGVALRVQISTTPGNESSWTDLQDGTSGSMTQNATDSTQFSFQLNQYPPANGVYFRALARASGSVDSLSNVIGPYTLTADKPPVVAITLSPLPSGGSGTEADPFIIKEDSTGFANIRIRADVTNSDRFIKTLSITRDGSTLDTFTNSSNGSVDHKTNVLGDHVIEGIAIDDLGVTARAGTGPVYVHIAPNDGTLKQSRIVGTRTTTSATGLQKDYTLIKDGGDWFDPTSWSDTLGGSGVPGAQDAAKIGSLSVSFSKDADVGFFSMNGGHLVGPGVLTIHSYGIVGSGGGSAVGFVQLFIAQSATFEMRNDANFSFDGIINDDGTFLMHGRGGLVGANTFKGSGFVDFGRPIVLASQPPLANRSLIRPLGALNVNIGGKVQATGLISQDGGGLVAQGGGNAIPTATLISQDGGGLVDKKGGTVVSHDGGSVVSHDGGSVVSHDGGSVVSHDGGSVVSHDGGSLVAQGGGNLVAQGGGNLVAQGGGNVIIANGSSFAGRSNVEAATGPSGYTQSSGETDLTGITIVGPVTLNGGVLSGTGIIDGSLTNNGGYIAPGHSPGLIAVTGNFNQGAGGTIIFEAAGAEANQFDQLQVGGTANLGGKLNVHTINGYVPLPNDPFAPLGYSAVTGSFASVTGNAQVTLTPTGSITIVDPAQPNPPGGQPANISTRMRVLTNDKVLIGGFIVTGPGGSTKKVLIRGMGPSLSKQGVSGVLSDPFLELHLPDGSTMSNDDWAQGPRSGEIPKGFQPDAKESVIVADLAPGAYTVIESGAHGETGVGLTEVYDFDPASAAQLANISTRGFVDTGDNVMIGGFIISGNEPAQILVRASGPSLKLPPANLTGVLEDPTLELTDANGNVIDNDDWRATQEQEIIASTVAPKDDREPAILATLAPGGYTAIVRGKNQTTGIAVVEAYKIK